MIGFIGGTGPEGRGLALRFAAAGEGVIIGSRERERGDAAAAATRALLPVDAAAGSIAGGTNDDAAQRGDLVVVALPYAGQRETLTALAARLAGKTVVNVVAPLVFAKGRAQAVAVDAGSAAEECRDLLPDSAVVGAFHNISAVNLLVPGRSLDCDVVVCADDGEARAQVMALAERIAGVRAVDGGALANARYLESLTSLLININRIYGAHSSIRITGI